MKTVPLHGAKAAGRVTLVDDGDYDLAMQYHWNIYQAVLPSGRMSAAYAVSNCDGLAARMHTLIMGIVGVDHRNRNGLDNQRSNLRIASQPENMHNIGPQPGGSSRLKGVWWDAPNRKWRSAITVNGECRYLGRFASEEDAARAYDTAARAAFPEFAYLNFPDAEPLTAWPGDEIRFCAECSSPMQRNPRGGPWPRRCPSCAAIRDQRQRDAASARYRQRQRLAHQEQGA